MIKYICVLVFAVLLLSCQNHSKKDEEKPKQTAFVFPEIPEMITEPDQRLSFLLKHFWEEFDFADTTLLSNSGITEQGFVNFISLLPKASAKDRLVGIDSLVRHSEAYPKVLSYMMNQAEKYLYEPNSPYYNEILYVDFMRSFVNSKGISYADKSRLEFRIALASKNCVGNASTDFQMKLYPKEVVSSLYSIVANQLLLIFYDPDCPHCQETLNELVSLKVLSQKIKEGLQVLAVYTEGNLELWRKTAPSMPKNWQIAIDEGCIIKEQILYDLKAMPSFYLLDAQKKVILKDVSIPNLLKYWGSDVHNNGSEEDNY